MADTTKEPSAKDGRNAGGTAPEAAVEGWWAPFLRPFWVLPMLICLVAWVAGLLLPLLDRTAAEHVPYTFQGGPAGARDLLGTIASAMISVTGLVFSITIVALQLASSQFTPRVLGAFLESRVTQATLGVFAASFIYALTVLRSVQTDYRTDEPFVPQISVTTAFVLVVASTGMFLAFIHHITRSMQVSHIVSSVGEETMAVVDAIHPSPSDGAPSPGWSPRPGTPRVVVTTDSGHGYVTQLDPRPLISCAKKHDAVAEVLVPVGQFLAEGQQVVRLWGVDEVDDRTARLLRGAISLGSERSSHQDPAFGLRRLVDIAVRALSTGVNDPTTAAQCLDELHRLLRRLVQRETPSRFVTDGEGTVRLVHRPQSVDDLVQLAVEEVLADGRDSVQVVRRMAAMLDDLQDVSLPGHLPAIQRWAARVDAVLAELETGRGETVVGA